MSALRPAIFRFSRHGISAAFHCARAATRIFLASTLLAPTLSQAGYISSEDFGASSLLYNCTSCGASVSTYDANTSLYTLDGSVPWLYEVPSSYPPIVSDLVGSFSLTATVGSGGSFLGGSYSFNVGSVSLGIAPGTEVLAGTLTSVEYVFGSEDNPAGVQSVGTIDLLNPTFASVAGPVGRVLIFDFASYPREWIDDPSSGPPTTPAWSQSATFLHYSTSPFVWLAAAVPEPETHALMLTGLGLLGLVRRKRKLRECAAI